MTKRNLLISFYEYLPGTFAEFVFDPSQDILKNIFESEDRPTTLNFRGKDSITFKVFIPIEHVEPNIATFFILLNR